VAKLVATVAKAQAKAIEGQAKAVERAMEANDDDDYDCTVDMIEMDRLSNKAGEWEQLAESVG
jgi:hypothetical protein